MTKIVATQPKVTILIPHYKTLELTRLCLRSIKKYTDLNTVRVLVIDNDSQDESTEYLRTLEWITLIERPSVPNEKPIHAHSNALDLGLAHTDTPYVLSIHTDTIVSKAGWLDHLVTEMESDPMIAGVGSGKLEYRARLSLLAKRFEKFLRTEIWYRLINSDKRNVFRYLRSHCALYKTDLIREHSNGFSDGGETAGRVLHRKLLDKGFKMKFVPDHRIVPYIKHLSHATQILNPEITSSTSKARTKKARRRIMRELESLNFRDILDNTELDQV